MCRPWWTPARLHQIACNQKYCAATKTRSSGDVDILSHTKGVYFDQYLSDCEQLYCLWVKISKSGPKYCLSIGFHKNCDPTLQCSHWTASSCPSTSNVVQSFIGKIKNKFVSFQRWWENLIPVRAGFQDIALNVAADRQLKLDKYILQVVQIHVLAVTDSKFPGRWMWRQAAPCKASGNLLYSAPHPSS